MRQTHILLISSIGIVIALVLLGGFDKAYACEVLSLPPAQEAYDNSAAVFSGRVVEFQEFNIEGVGDRRVAFFEVDRYWKTLNENDYKELVIITEISHGACGYDFEAGNTYLVYAGPWWRDPGSLHTSIGTRTQPIENAQEDLAVLGEGRASTKELSWDEQINRITIQPRPNTTEVQTNTVLLVIGTGGAIAGVVAFFTLRRLKEKE